jgi:hypothetical protein
MKSFASFGLLPDNQDQAATSYYRTYPNAIPSAGANYDLYYGQPVTLDAVGNVKPVTAVTEPILGSFGGVRYVDPTAKSIVVANRYIKNTQFLGFLDPINEIRCQILIIDVNDTILRIQATGPLSNAAINAQFNLDTTTQVVTNPDGSVYPFVGNTTPLLEYGNYFGMSTAALNPTEVTTSGESGQFIVVGNLYTAGNQLTDQFPIVLVKINKTMKYPEKVVV